MWRWRAVAVLVVIAAGCGPRTIDEADARDATSGDAAGGDGARYPTPDGKEAGGDAGGPVDATTDRGLADVGADLHAGADADTGADAGTDAASDATTDREPADAGAHADARADGTADAGADAAAPAAAPDGAAADARADAAANDAAAPDGGDVGPPPACDPSKPFSTPQAVPGVDTGLGTTSSIDFMPDMLTAYVGSNQQIDAPNGNVRLGVAVRTGVDVDFGRSTVLPGPVNAVTASDPRVLVDGLTLYFVRNRSGGGSDVVVSTRASLADPFGAPAVVPRVNVGLYQEGPFLARNGRMLYYGVTYPGGQGQDGLYVADLQGSSPPVLLPELGAFGPPRGAVLTADELTIYFWLIRDNRNADIAVARRSSITAAFGPPAWVDELNSPDGDSVPAWLSPDGCTMYLAVSGAQANEIFRATRGR